MTTQSISIEVVENPTLQFGDRPVAIELGCEMSAELRLAPGALEEQHQQPGGCKCHVATEIVLHQRQGEIHPSASAATAAGIINWVNGTTTRFAGNPTVVAR